MKVTPVLTKETWSIQLLFKLEDFWVGAYWEKREPKTDLPNKVMHLWICMIPCFPIYIKWLTKERRAEPWEHGSIPYGNHCMEAE